VRSSTRLERAAAVAALESRLAAGQTQRQAAAALGVARSTLQGWRNAAASANPALPASCAAVLETPAGIGWLQRLVLAAVFVITLRAGAGVRMVCEFLELSGLSGVVAASYGSQQALTAVVEAAVVAVAEEQRAQLAAGMAPRQVAVCEDETFHPATCLVALEPISNFIVLEQYAEDRSAATWTEALRGALAGLPVEVIQGTSDEAKALCRHQRHDYHAQHSPDLFHVQHEVSKATSLHLARQVKQSATRLAAAEATLQEVQAAEQAYQAQRPHPPGRPPDFAQHRQAALATWGAAAVEHEQAQAHQAEARGLLRALGQLYHPYDLASGVAQPVAAVAARFAAVWTRLQRLATVADLPARAHAHLAKAERVTTELLATLAFVLATLQAKVEALNLPADLEEAMHLHLIPALYLERVATRTTHAEQRQALRVRSAELLAPLRQREHPLQRLPAAERARIEQVATDCANLFQRSSSAVEGRNGHLALFHHGCHRLSARKLAALTAVHNYHSRRPDGTTAARRFFGRAHAPLFEQLLERVPLPPRPRRHRPLPPRQPYLLPVAA
jgi:transcriptional regulator with XRE-family HTH domain